MTCFSCEPAVRTRSWRSRQSTSLSELAPFLFFFFSSRRRHTRLQGDWSSDVCSSDLLPRARRCGARAGGLVAVLGIGGLGHLGVQFAVRLGFETVAVARGKEKEIGRASCRGRGEISVGGVSFKKKKKRRE